MWRQFRPTYLIITALTYAFALPCFIAVFSTAHAQQDRADSSAADTRPALKIIYLQSRLDIRHLVEKLDTLDNKDALERALENAGFAGIVGAPVADLREMRAAMKGEQAGVVFATPALLRSWSMAEWRVTLQKRNEGDIWSSRPGEPVKRRYIVFCRDVAERPALSKGSWAFCGSEDDSSYLFPRLYLMQEEDAASLDSYILRDDPFEVFASIHNGLADFGVLEEAVYLQLAAEHAQRVKKIQPIGGVSGTKVVQVEAANITVPSDPVLFSNLLLPNGSELADELEVALISVSPKAHPDEDKPPFTLVKATNAAFQKVRENVLLYYQKIGKSEASIP